MTDYKVFELDDSGNEVRELSAPKSKGVKSPVQAPANPAEVVELDDEGNPHTPYQSSVAGKAKAFASGIPEGAVDAWNWLITQTERNPRHPFLFPGSKPDPVQPAFDQANQFMADNLHQPGDMPERILNQAGRGVGASAAIPGSVGSAAQGAFQGGSSQLMDEVFPDFASDHPVLHQGATTALGLAGALAGRGAKGAVSQNSVDEGAISQMLTGNPGRAYAPYQELGLHSLLGSAGVGLGAYVGNRTPGIGGVIGGGAGGYGGKTLAGSILAAGQNNWNNAVTQRQIELMKNPALLRSIPAPQGALSNFLGNSALDAARANEVSGALGQP